MQDGGHVAPGGGELLPGQEKLPPQESFLHQLGQPNLAGGLSFAFQAAPVLLLCRCKLAAPPLLQGALDGEGAFQRGAKFRVFRRLPEELLLFGDAQGKHLFLRLLGKGGEEFHRQVAFFREAFPVHREGHREAPADAAVEVAEIAEHLPDQLRRLIFQLGNGGGVSPHVILQLMLDRRQEAQLAFLFGHPPLVL